MCGIAGLIGLAFDGREALLRKLTERIAHRGPDDEGTWSDDHAALAHRRLSILDLTPAGHQPMASHCGRYVLVYNGELYNYALVPSATQIHYRAIEEILSMALTLKRQRNLLGAAREHLSRAVYGRRYAAELEAVLMST